MKRTGAYTIQFTTGVHTQGIHIARRFFCSFILYGILLGIPGWRAQASPEAGRDVQPVVQEIRQRLELLARHAVVFPTETLTAEATRALLRAVDRQGELISRRDYHAALSARQGYAFHAGFYLRFRDGFAFVRAVYDNTPAARAGIKQGDLLVSVNGLQVEGLIPPEVLGLLRADSKDTMHIEIQRESTVTEAFDISVSEVLLPAIENVEWFHGDVLYIRLNGFYQGAGVQLVNFLLQSQDENMIGAILDVRGAGGESLSAVNDLLEALAPAGKELYSFRNAPGEESSRFISRLGRRTDQPVMLLTDGQTSGAAEVLVAACRGVIPGVLVIGEATRGDPLLREYIALNDREGLWMATRKLATPAAVYDGSEGVEPDVHVSADWHSHTYMAGPGGGGESLSEAERSLRDRVAGDGPLSRATDLLRGLRALNLRPTSVD